MSDVDGWSLVEMLVVIAILAVLAGIGMALMRPSPSRHAAVLLATELTAARLRALAGGAPTAVVADGPSDVRRRVGAPWDDAPSTCTAGRIDASTDLASFPGVVIASGLDDGIVWFPTGWGRTCSGAGVYNRRIVIAGPRRSHAVIVSSAGRVRWEVVP